MTDDPVEIAWLAGLFEGEGCISIGQQVRIIITMTDRDVLERVDAIWPASRGIKPCKKQQPHHKTCYTWTLCGENVLPFLQRMLPHFGERRAERARRAVAIVVERANKHNRNKSHCPKGHPYAGDNLYVWRGRRSCRICVTDRKRRSLRRQRERAIQEPRNV